VPELPEVETIRTDLDPELRGARITRVRIYHDDLILGGDNRRSFSQKVRGRTIGGVDRRAKYLLFSLFPAGAPAPGAEPERLMRVQLRMTGKFSLGLLRPASGEFRHPGIELGLDDARTLFYDDTRRLGGFDLLTPAQWKTLEARIGPEPLPSGFTWSRLDACLSGSRAPIKNALLDQHRLAGVGNIYASEALFRSGIDPRRVAGSLDPCETRRLHRAIRAVLREALASAGTTLRDYRAVNGRSGSFQSRLRVYGRDGGPCPRCRHRLSRIVQAGRSTFFCENCQH
jgi:formamidopyrimidine-DNA glycosylase